MAQAAAAVDSPAALAQTPTPGKPVLSVCADPANLPYSSDRTPGFENRIAAVLAADMKADLHTTWFAAYRSFLKSTLLAGACDVIVAVPSALPGVLVTKPYFESAYVAVTRVDDPRRFASFDDPWLNDAKIGIQLIGIDRADTPPAKSLESRNINRHITGFALRSGNNTADPQSRIIDAVASGQIDVAFAWGPIAGYYAKSHGTALRLQTITQDPKDPSLVFGYRMSMAVRKSDTALRDRLQAAIDRHQTEIANILRDYGIPTVPLPKPSLQEPLPLTLVTQKAGSPPPTR
jgi:mxaJ protein